MVSQQDGKKTGILTRALATIACLVSLNACAHQGSGGTTTGVLDRLPDQLPIAIFFDRGKCPVAVDNSDAILTSVKTNNGKKKRGITWMAYELESGEFNEDINFKIWFTPFSKGLESKKGVLKEKTFATGHPKAPNQRIEYKYTITGNDCQSEKALDPRFRV
jgi:hypothetical protein